MQITSHVLMVRPSAFGYNPETAVSNGFSKKNTDFPEEIARKALQEFDNMVGLLQKADLNVTVIDDTLTPCKPDAVFPNNWLTMHSKGTIVLYPMQATNRRTERREYIIETLKRKYKVGNVIDLSHYESKNKFLEGSGSMVLDHVNRIVYASISIRTDKDVLERFCSSMDYRKITFNALDVQKKPIYHTNVVMNIGQKFVMICLDAIEDEYDKEELLESFRKTGKNVIKITYPQMENFVGNALELANNKGEHVLVLSQRAYDTLQNTQEKQLQNYVKFLPCPIETIETYGGGSARCMLAEIFLPTF